MSELSLPALDYVAASPAAPRSLLRLLQNPQKYWTEAIFCEPTEVMGAGRTRVRFISDPAIITSILADREGAFVDSPIMRRILAAGYPQELIDDHLAKRRETLALSGQSTDQMRVKRVKAICEGIADEWIVSGPQSGLDIVLDTRRLTLGALWRAFLDMGTERGALDINVEAACRQIHAQPINATLLERTGALRVLAARYLTEKEAMLKVGTAEYELRLNLLLVILDAGHDNSGATLAWALWLLARRPDLQGKIREEAAEATHFGGPTTRAVLWESMRLYPPLISSTRMATRRYELGGITIERGETVVLAVYPMHRHRAHWERPDAFFPERFIDAHGALTKANIMLPFGAGPRGCPGVGFAQMVLLTAITQLLCRVELAPNPASSLSCETNFALRPIGHETVFARSIL